MVRGRRLSGREDGRADVRASTGLPATGIGRRATVWRRGGTRAYATLGLALSMDQEMGAIRAAMVVRLMKPGEVVVQLVESGAEQERAPCGTAAA